MKFWEKLFSGQLHQLEISTDHLEVNFGIWTPIRYVLEIGRRDEEISITGSFIRKYPGYQNYELVSWPNWCDDEV